ncbi:hypothetical protein F5X71_29800 [Nocardia brasiliensis]|uniref:RNA polymerase alpha subunit C-terminal domain-containing protein n=1 Tax=Nocardia brasiliensis TaxID=37326 RepID=A0A6G9XYC5_NOCBR|nr:hypothetical protein [Nocardia brasiliensis]QIS05945.1 hypothetical protein F5X71_29800 [Nocardia brasiliensis]
MSIQTKSATFTLDGRPGVEYETTITETFSGEWELTEVRITSSGGLAQWDLQPSIQRLVYNTLHQRDMMVSMDGAEPAHEFDWMATFTKHILCRKGIHTMADLSEKTDAQLLEIADIGPIRVNELRQGITAWKAKTEHLNKPSTATST